MNDHLSDAQLMDAVTNTAGAEEADHLKACLACREEVERWRACLKEARQAVRKAADRPESYWLRQRRLISARLDQRRPFRRPYFLAWAGGAALLALAVTLTIYRPRPDAPQAAPDRDDELLIEVERSVQRALPVALEPAVLLVEEANKLAGPKSVPK